MPAGTADPDRRDRIARAGIDVVAAVGVEGLTHRAVAVAARVPLGSTTYHFRSKDELLAAALEQARAAHATFMAGWADALGDQPDLVAALTDYTVTSSGTNRQRLLVAYELYVAAFRRPALQPLSQEWDRALEIVLARFTDPLTARALNNATSGLLLASLTRGEALSAAEVEPVLRRIVAS
jgi:TetR/AcrR family transcriptional regulator, regulator of biofilm formation and stress response